MMQKAAVSRKAAVRPARTRGEAVEGGSGSTQLPPTNLMSGTEEEFRRQVDVDLGELHARIDALDLQAASVGKRAQREFQEVLTPLRWRAEALGRRVDRFFSDEAGRWDGVRQEAFVLFRGEVEEIRMDLLRLLREIDSIFRRRYPPASRFRAAGTRSAARKA